MRKSKAKQVVVGCASAMACALVSPGVHAISMGDRVDLSGYGHVGFLKNNGNNYGSPNGVIAPDRGAYDEYTLALVISASISDRSKLWTHFHNSSTETRLDWGYIDYRFTGELVGRAGKVKLPIGVYNDYIDVRFLQMSTQTPFLYREEARFAREAYLGAGLTYELPEFAGGSLALDLYQGQPAPFGGDLPNTAYRRTTGGRLVYGTPVPGLRLMVSASSSRQDNTVTGVENTQPLGVLTADYVDGPFDIKAEWGQTKVVGVKARTWYVQGGYTVNEVWTPFLRYDYIATDTSRSSDDSYSQKAIVAGLSYRFNDNVKFRGEFHRNQGYGLPVAQGSMTAGAGRPQWNTILFSVNFIF